MDTGAANVEMQNGAIGLPHGLAADDTRFREVHHVFQHAIQVLIERRFDGIACCEEVQIRAVPVVPACCEHDSSAKPKL